MKKKRGLKININFTNRWLYTFIFVGILIAVGVGVYAYGTSNPSAFGHSASEMAPPSPCTANQYLQFDGTSWKCATPPLNPLTKGTTLVYTITNSYCAGVGSLTTASTCPTRSSGTCWWGVANGGINYYSCTGAGYCVCASCAGPTCSNNPLGYLVN